MIVGDPQLRVSIIASVVAALLVIFVVEPLLSITSGALVWLGDNVYQGINNLIYSSAATHSGDILAVLILFFVFLFGTTGIVLFVTYSIASTSVKVEAMRRRTSIELERYNEEPELDSDKLLDEYGKIENRRIKLLEKLGSLEKKTIKFQETTGKMKMGFAFLLVFNLILFIGFMTIQYVKVELNRSFNQNITVLAPHISDAHYEELRASWVLMQNREDYQAIVTEMVRLGNENGIESLEIFLD